MERIGLIGLSFVKLNCTRFRKDLGFLDFFATPISNLRELVDNKMFAWVCFYLSFMHFSVPSVAKTCLLGKIWRPQTFHYFVRWRDGNCMSYEAMRLSFQSGFCGWGQRLCGCQCWRRCCQLHTDAAICEVAAGLEWDHGKIWCIDVMSHHMTWFWSVFFPVPPLSCHGAQDVLRRWQCRIEDYEVLFWDGIWEQLNANGTSESGCRLSWDLGLFNRF